MKRALLALALVLLPASTQASQEVFSGEITSASPSTFTPGVAATVTVRIRSTSGSGNVIIEWDSCPSGWTISPKNRNPTVTQGTYYDQTFTVTSPSGVASSGTIVWKLYDDDYGTHPSGSVLLATRNQSVTSPYDTTAPTVPSLSSPASGAITTDNTVALDWTDSTDASGISNYEVQVDDSSTFASPNWTSLPTSSSATTAALGDGLYYWRVRAKDNASTPNWSAWSSSRSFRVDTTAPSVPTLVSPANGSSTGDQTPTFDWNDSSDGGAGVDHYEVDIYDGDLTWGDINTTVTSSTYTPGSNIPYDTIYWRIRAYDRAGNVSAWSTVWSVNIVDTVAPTVPSLSSPADGTITSDNTVSLDWSDSSDSGSGVSGYEVQVDDSSAFGSPNWTSAPGSSSTTTAALGDGVYYWRVRAKDNVGNFSSWSSSRSFRVDTTAPSVPTLISPSNGSSTGDQTPAFDWADSSDGGSGMDHYEVDIYDGDLTWGDINTTVTTSTYTPGSNIPYDTIYWRIRAYDRAGNVSAWSTVWSVIIIDNVAPTIPTLSSPADATITSDNTVSLDWTDATDSGTGLSGYEVQVDDSNTFTSPNWTGAPGSSSDTTAALSDGLYYWRVRARDNANNYSSWSASRSFRVDTTAPSIPSLVSPSNGGSTGDQTPTFDWADSSDAGSGLDHYEVDIYDGDLTWGDINTTVTPSTYTPGSNIPFDTIYWRIRAYDRAGNVSAWSTVWSVIIIDNVAPSVPALSGPADAAITSDNTVALDWADSTDTGTGVSGYEVQVDDSSTFGSPNWTSLPTSSSATTAALGDGLYYWRVRAKDNASTPNWSAWSSSRSFRVDTAPPSVPSLVSPANGSSTGDQTPTFDWNDSTDTVSGVDHYEVDIYDGDLTWGDLNTTVTTSIFTPSSDIPLDTIYWRIRAYDRAGNVSAWSTEWSVVIAQRIVSAYWWMPLDVSDGDTVTMCAEVEGIPVGAQCTFQIYEDDGILLPDDPVDTPVNGTVYTAEGKTYVKATWSAAWQGDQWLGGDPEHYFKVTYGSISRYSSRDQDNELIVRNDRQLPSSVHGDFYYSTGEATAQAGLTDSRIPVILVHGASGDRKTNSLNYWYGWANGDMAPAEAKLGRFNTAGMRSSFRVYRYVYDSRLSIAENGQAFAAFVNQFYATHPEFAERQLVIMAHSMGGLVSRYALNTDAAFQAKVHRLITLGTPHLGSPLANPSWVRQESPSETATEAVLSVLYYSNFGGTQGDFDLAWHNLSQIPASARMGGAYYNWTVNMGYFRPDLLNASLTTPFAGSANVTSVAGDTKITAYGGNFTTAITGEGPTWPEKAADEVIKFGLTDHAGLLTLRNALWDMNYNDGSTVGNSDGMVPLTSALLGSAHPDAEKINLTTGATPEPVDHSSYLDVPSTMDYVAKRLLTMAKVVISPQDAIDVGARWRISSGAWQKSGVSLSALKPGQYLIEFKDVPGWIKPNNQTVTVTENQTYTLSGSGATYTPANTVPTDIALSNSTVSENQPSVTIVGTLSTTDPDLGNTFTYTLVTGTGSTDNGSFSINGSTLRTAAIFNYESKSTYSIRVRSADQGGLYFEKSFTISVLNVNEQPTDISLSGSSAPENQPPGTAVGSFTTADPDTGNTFAYSLVSGTGSGDNASFSISGNTLLTATSFNYEGRSTYSIRVRTTDQGALAVEKAFTVTVTDVAEKPAPPSNLSPPNGAPNQSLTLSLQASAFSDPDAGSTHAASQWVVRRASDSAVIFDSSEDTVNRISCSVPSGRLMHSTNYVWQVRYKDKTGLWSDYSAQTAFGTVAPSLAIKVQGSTVVLTWPTNAVGFMLMSTTNLVTNPVWTQVSPPPVVVSGQNAVSNSISSQKVFYRLTK